MEENKTEDEGSYSTTSPADPNEVVDSVSLGDLLSEELNPPNFLWSKSTESCFLVVPNNGALTEEEMSYMEIHRNGLEPR